MATRIKRATPADAALLWQWRNDPIVRNNSFNTEVIPWEEHAKWFNQRVAADDTRIYLLEDNSKVVAQVRYERSEGFAHIGGISVAADDRGKGYGRQVLQATLSLACADLGVEKVIAIVKKANTASLRSFRSVGFVLEESVMERGNVCSRLVYSCHQTPAT
ncbi:MAG: GNAT family N-acetyltransferase [Nitrospira sp.]